MMLFRVSYKRLGRYRGINRAYEARSVAALDEPIREDVERLLRKGQMSPNITVTINEAEMNGQLDYGLTGEFTISG